MASTFLERGPVGTAARTAIVGTAGFAVGAWALDDLQFAVFAAFTGIALSGFADYGGSLRGRAVANAVTGLAAMTLVAVGTVVSESVVLGPIAALLLTFVVVIAGGLGGYARAGSRVLVIFLVLAIGIPASIDDLGDRIGGVALGTLLVTVASLTLWPARPRQLIEEALAEAASALAAGLAALAAGADGVSDAITAADAAAANARRRAARLGATPAGPAARDRSRAYLLDDLVRATRIMAEVGPPPDPAGGHRAVAEIVHVGHERLADARRLFLEVADAMRGVKGERLAAAQAALGRTDRDLAGVVVGPEDSRTVVAASEWALVVNELAWTAGAAAAHASGDSVPLGRGDRPDESYPEDEPAVGLVRRAAGVIRADLSPRSPRFQDSVRIAVALGVAVSVTAVLDLSHGFWVSLATLTVLKTAARSTAISAFDAIVGTLIGFGLSVLIVLAADVEHPTYAIALPILIFLSIWANGAIGLAAGQAAFTMTVVVLFNLLEPSGWELGIARVEDVVVGAVAGIAIGVFAWPRGSRAELGGATGELIEAAARYADLVLAGLLVGEERRRVDRAERFAVTAASQRLDEVIQLSLAEGRPGPERMAYWIAIAGEAHRLSYIADHSSLSPVDDVPACAPLRDYLEGAVDRATGLYERAGQEIGAGRLPTPGAVMDRDEVRALVEECLARSRSLETIVTLARLLLIARWVGVASAAIEGLRSEVELASAPDPSELLASPRPAEAA